MEAHNSPPEPSPPPLVISSAPLTAPSRKRKHASIANTAAPSPAPSDSRATPTIGAESVIVPTRQGDLSRRQRLTISRHPVFVPIFTGSPYCNTEPLCNNRLNFRYTPAGLSNTETGIPFRTIESAPPSFRVSWEDRSTFIKVTQDGLGLIGEKGFRSARCNAPVREGKWYMEVKIELGGGEKAPESQRREGSHIRLGWARREAPLNGPAGLDGYSYAYRDKTGEKVHLSRPRPYGQPFQTGDVVGMYISLPSPRRAPNRKDTHDPAHIKRERIAIDFKGQEYFESLEYPQSKEMIALMDANDRAKASNITSMPSSATKKSATVKNLPSTSRGSKTSTQELSTLRPLPTLGPDSHVAFFLNGKCQGVAFRDLFDYLPLRAAASKNQEKHRKNKEGLREHRENPFDDGTLGYYPFISLFNEARVRINPGPDFEYPPPPDIDAVLSSADNPDSDMKPLPSEYPRTWRPMCERYPEFIFEQKALDDLEEKEWYTPPQVANDTTTDLTQDSEQERLRLEKLEAHRAKRRAQAAARRERKLKQAREEPDVKRRKVEEVAAQSGEAQPSPQLDDVASRQSYASPDPSPHLGFAPGYYPGTTTHSPAPTVASTMDEWIPSTGRHQDSSAYNSEVEEVDYEMKIQVQTPDGQTETATVDLGFGEEVYD